MKCALITGGSRGIGRAVSIQLARDLNYHILINYQSNQEAALATLADIEGNGGSAELIRFDVGNRQETHQALNQWQDTHPDLQVEVIVNNAGITRDGLFMWMEPADWDQVIRTSLNGFYNITSFFMQKMLHRKYGRIINMVSISGVKGTAGQVNYSAAKAALVGATKALAQEVAKRNITVNAVAPGYIRTDMTASLDEKELKKNIPANRFGEAEEVADLVSFLASPKASYINGEVININGGLYS
ncbi:MAG: 3-oxoacyl-ACP reductase FabG [Taibaiella sp.]|nr:3-oxoacyl-ACP reductase FabG [Taibaiella sp.]